MRTGFKCFLIYWTFSAFCYASSDKWNLFFYFRRIVNNRWSFSSPFWNNFFTSSQIREMFWILFRTTKKTLDLITFFRFLKEQASVGDVLKLLLPLFIFQFQNFTIFYFKKVFFLLVSTHKIVIFDTQRIEPYFKVCFIFKIQQKKGFLFVFFSKSLFFGRTFNFNWLFFFGRLFRVSSIVAAPDREREPLPHLIKLFTAVTYYLTQ
jgi:hypothetical protein